MAYLHSHQILHRYLVPTNILVRPPHHASISTERLVLEKMSFHLPYSRSENISMPRYLILWVGYITVSDLFLKFDSDNHYCYHFWFPDHFSLGMGMKTIITAVLSSLCHCFQGFFETKKQSQFCARLRAICTGPQVYMAPEAMERFEFTAAADVYSFGEPHQSHSHTTNKLSTSLIPIPLTNCLPVSFPYH